MKVICINSKNPKDYFRVFPEDYLKEGNVYTVTEIRDTANGLYYLLKERPSQDRRRVEYNANRFVIIPKGTELFCYEDVLEKMIEKEREKIKMK